MFTNDRSPTLEEAIALRQDDPAVALVMVEEAINTFWQNGHPRVAAAFLLRAEILKIMGSDVPTFDHLEELPDAILADMSVEAMVCVKRSSPKVAQAVLKDLLPLISGRLGKHHKATINIQTMLANLGRNLESCEGRIETIRKVLTSHEARGDQALAIQTRMGLALALDEAGDSEGCVAAYKQAIEQAYELGDARLCSQGLRNLGLFYSEQHRVAEAEKTLRLAVEDGRDADDDEMLGRSLIALGIFLQHNGDLHHAESLLVDAINRLDPSHPDCICARSHLQAIRTDSSCDCGDIQNAFSKAFHSYVLDRIPEGLIEDLQIQWQDGKLQVNIYKQQKPTPDQIERLDRILQQARIEFKKQLAEGID